MKISYKYHHIGIPTHESMPGMLAIPHLKIGATDHEANPFGIQWMKYESGCAVPELVRKVPHVAFEVKDLKTAIRGRKIIVAPNSPSPGVLVAMIEQEGAPVELLQFTDKRANRRYRRREKERA